MNDRDFKLLVREYFQTDDKLKKVSVIDDFDTVEDLVFKKCSLKRRILSELEAFTLKDVNELPFKD